MTTSAPQPFPRILRSSAERGWNALDADLVLVPAGRMQAPPRDRHGLGMHFGPPVNADCIVGGVRRRGVQRPGDMGLVPAGADGSWEDDAACQVLRLSLRPGLIEQVAAELEQDARRIALAPRPRFRDARLEAIGWAIKADLEADAPSDPLFIDLLSNALAVRLVELGMGRPVGAGAAGAQGLSRRQKTMLVELIETRLDQKLRLADLAATVGVGPTRFKALFRTSFGTPAHQHVIRRRVECARALLATTTMPAKEIAVAAGFAHQSHMATAMRRVLGSTPGEIARHGRES